MTSKNNRSGADLSCKDGQRHTALLHAVHAGHESTALSLLNAMVQRSSQSHDGVDDELRSCWPALMQAAAKGYVEILRVLPKDNIGRSSRSNGPVFRHLLECGADSDAVGTMGMTALMRAASAGQRVIVSALLENRADLEAKDTNGWSALMHCIENGHSTTVKCLLDARADIETQDKLQRRPLMIAASARRPCRDHVSIVRLLLQSRADVDASGSNGISAHMYAIRQGNHSVANALLEAVDIDVDD